MALDESKENDEIIKAGGNTYIIEKVLLEKAAPITVDFTETGFRIDSPMDLGRSGCGSCASAGSCS